MQEYSRYIVCKGLLPCKTGGYSIGVYEKVRGLECARMRCMDRRCRLVPRLSFHRDVVFDLISCIIVQVFKYILTTVHMFGWKYQKLVG